MHHFLVISEFNFVLQSGNAQIRSILAIFCLLWPWNFTDDLQKQKGISSMSFQALRIISQPSVKLNFSYSLESFKSGRIWRFFAPCDLQILRTTLKNNRAPLLYPFKLYASFHSHWRVYTWVIVHKRSSWVKIDDYLPSVTLKFYGWPWKTIGHILYAHSSFMYHLVAIDEFRFEL